MNLQEITFSTPKDSVFCQVKTGDLYVLLEDGFLQKKHDTGIYDSHNIRMSIPILMEDFIFVGIL